MSWFRVPQWCMGVVEGESAVRARAWVYLLGAWHAGDRPSVREFRRVTGFGGPRADALVGAIWEWAKDNGADHPETCPVKLAGHFRGTSGAEAGHPDKGTTPEIEDERGKSGAETGQKRGARARDPLLVEREVDQERTQDAPEGAPPAVAGSAPEPRPEVDLQALWGALVAFAPKPDAWVLNSTRRKALRARIADHDPATVLRVAEWVRTSPHERASFLRERGDVDTLLRKSRFDTYAAMSLEGTRPAGGVDTPAGAIPKTDDERWYAWKAWADDVLARREDPQSAKSLRGFAIARRACGSWANWKSAHPLDRERWRGAILAAIHEPSTLADIDHEAAK